MVQIPLRAARLSALLGVAVDFGEVLGILDRLGLRTVSRSEDGEQALVSGASHRPDIAIEADLIEEVARIRGLDEIPTRLPAIVPQPPRSTGELERDAADIAAGLGLSEALTYAFVSEQQLTALSAPAPSVVLQNPLTEERSVMRTSLLPGLLETVRRSRRRGENSLRLFTVGARFLAPLEGEQAARSRAARPAMDGDRGVLPEERPSFAAVLAGPRPAHLCIKAEDYDVFDAKGVAVEMAERLSQTEAEVKPAGDDPTCRHLHPRGRGLVLVEGVRVGVFGPLHPDIVDALDLDGPVQIVEMDLAAFESLELKVPRHRPIPRLPAIRRDLSFVVREEVNAGDVAALIAGSAGELCESVEIVADFRGASVPAGCRSITFRVTYRDPKAATDPDKARTLTDKEVDSVQDDIIRSTSQKLGAELRG
jgi:phenylalanyl-tRNA synthetase beta chain